MATALKDVKIILPQANDSATFRPSLLSGILEMCPSQNILITEIQVKLVGRAFVSIDGTERREDFLDITQTIFPNDDEPSNWETTTLQENVRYTLPFTFQLMSHLPSSFEINSTYSGIKAYVQYSLESAVIRPKNIVALKYQREFKFRQTRQLSAITAEHTTPKLYRKSLRLGMFASTSVHLDCKLDRTAFYNGEVISLFITVDNRERRAKTKFILAQLVQDIDVIMKENEHPSLHRSSTIKVLQSIVVVDSIEARKCETLSNVQLPIQLMDSPPTVETRKSLLLNYAIVVKVVVDDRSKLCLKIPILVIEKETIG